MIQIFRISTFIHKSESPHRRMIVERLPSTQGNDLAESVALITAGNAITQDVSKTAGETLPERYRRKN